MKPVNKKALSGGSRQGKGLRKSFWANHPTHGAAIKRVIVFLAMRDLLPARLATWLINALGLKWC